MMAPPRFLLRSGLQEGESLKGYLTRLALLNGYRNFSWLLRAANLNTALFDRGSASLHGLAIMTGRSMPELEAIYWPASSLHRNRPGQHRLAHVTVPAWLLNLRHPRVCPRCIREGRPLQRTWDIAWITCCPRHGNYLVSQCSRCGKPLSWDRPWLHRCSCGFGLPALPVKKAPPSEIALSALFGERFAAEPITDSCQPLPAWLLSLPPAELLSFFLKLSALELDPKPPQQLSSMCLDVGTAISVTSRLAKLLATWPGSITTHLDRVMAYLDTSERSSGQALRIRETVRGLFAEDAPMEIRTALKDWIEASREQAWLQPGGLLSEQIHRTHPHAKEIESLRASLGLGKHAFSYALSMIRASVLEPGHRTPLALESNELEKLKELVVRWRSSLSELEVANALGLTRRDIGSLVRAGLLTPESIPKDGHKFSKRFDCETINRFVGEIFAMATPIADSSAPELNNLLQIREQFGRRAFIGQLLISILSGSLKCYCLQQKAGQKKLSQIRLKRHEVNAHLYPTAKQPRQ